MTGPGAHGAIGWALVFALVFPTVMAWIEFAQMTPADPAPNRVAQIAYGGGKLLQLALPLLCCAVFERRIPCPAAPHFRGLMLGLGFGLIVAAGMLGLYYGIIRETVLFQQAPELVHGKLKEFNLDSPAGFALFAGFIIVLHSLLEEYYWRWFVFGWLRRYVSVASAIALSSTSFMAFHVFALMTYLPEHFFTAVVPFALCTGAGGAVWAWLYQRTGSIYAPWLSHLIVDAALFVVGYDLWRLA